MLSRLFTIMLLLAATLSFGQVTHTIPFAKNPYISDKKGKPQTPETHYLPADYFRDTFHAIMYTGAKSGINPFDITRRLAPDCKYPTLEDYAVREKVPTMYLRDTLHSVPDAQTVALFSNYLFKMSEPLLYNYHLGREVYRFFWFRSSDNPIAIRVEKRKSAAVVEIKILDKKILCPTCYWLTDADTVNKSPLIDIAPVVITNKQYKQFRKFVRESKVKTAGHVLRRGCAPITDGSEWIFEMQDGSGYYFMSRKNPGPNGSGVIKDTLMYELGKLMINLAALKDEKVY